MKLIPRIGGTWWPACLVAALLLLLPLGAVAQGQGPGGGQSAGQTGAIQGSSPGTETVVTPNGTVIMNSNGEVLSIGQTELAMLPPPLPKIQFTRPSYFKVEDRQNDEGGAFALLWPQSPDDGKVDKVKDPATGEESEKPAYEYWPFHASAKPDGTPDKWVAMDPVQTASAYVYEQKTYFNKAFFHGDKTLPTDEHYAFFESTYPQTGVYNYAIKSEVAEPRKITVTAKVYDPAIKDYKNLEVTADLSPFGGGKEKLDFVPPEPGETRAAWDNTFQKVVDLDTSKVPTTKTHYMMFTAKTSGKDKVVLAVEPVRDSKNKDIVTLKGSGSEQAVPDNRDKHFFRLYVAPAGFELPEGMELPPQDWLVGEQVGPIVGKANLWNGSRTNAWVWGIFISLAVMLYITAAKKGTSLFVRRISGLDHVDEAIGRATEMGRPILYITGIGAMTDIATIASVNILGRVGRRVADYESRLLVPSYDPIVMAVCQEVLQDAYIDAGRPDAYKKDDVFYLTSDQFAYAAAVDGIMVREKPATNFLVGIFFAESLLLAETGASTGAIQIAGTDQMAQLPFLVTACDYTLIGEELYAASAYLSREPVLLGSLKGQDLGKLVLMIWTLVGTIAIFAGIEFFKHCFQAF
jgi:hypothetical protein